MNIDFKNLGIGAAAGAAIATLAVNTPKIAKATKEKLKGAKLNRSLKRKKKQESDTNVPEGK